MRVAMPTMYPVDMTSSPGGVRAVAYNLAQGLKQFPDLDIHVLHCGRDVIADRVEGHGNLTVHFMSLPRQRLIPNMVRSVWLVRRALRQIRPDVVHSHLSWYSVAAVGKFPTLWTIHGMAFREAQIYSRTLFDRLRWSLTLHYVRRALRSVKHLVAISPFVLEEYGAMTTAKWYRVDNPIADAFFQDRTQENANRILFAGSIDERKNPLDLLRVLATVRDRFPEAELHIAGRVTNPSYSASVKDYVRAKGLERNVTFCGLLGPDELRRAYRECALLALTSRQETQPMVVIEAMASGRPVVATRVGGVADLIDDGITGFIVDVGDIGGAARRVCELLSDPERRARMGRAARAKADARFRLSRVAERYIEIYRETMKAFGAGPTRGTDTPSRRESGSTERDRVRA